MSSRIRSLPAHELNADHVQTWLQTLEECDLLETPHLRPEFTQALGAVRPDIKVAMVEEAGEVAALLPYRRMPWGGGRPAAGSLANVQAIIARANYEVDTLGLVRACGLRNWQFDRLLSPPKSVLPYVWRSWDSPYADLSQGYEGYCRKMRMDRKRLSEFGRLQRKMAREIGDVRFEPHVASDAVLKSLMEWKSAQYKRTRQYDIFSAQWVRNLLSSLLQYQERSFSSLLSALYAGNRLVAISFGLRSGSNMHGWFTAFDRTLSAYSPGSQLLLELFRAAESIGIRRIDLGTGPEEYKRRFMTDAAQVYEGAIDTSALVSGVRRQWWQVKNWVRSSCLAGATRTSLAPLRGVQSWLEMR